MNIWKILGIEPSKDKNILKNAYREKLVTVNPEDDAKGFMELRKAYEEALRLSEVADDSATSDLSKEPILNDISALYKNYKLRINPEEWQALFNRDEFVSLDTSEENFDCLMRFFMEHFYLPKCVWSLFVDFFDVKNRKKELTEKYPAEYISYIMNNATYDDVFAYAYLEGDEDRFDEFIDIYYKLDIAIRRRDQEAQKTYFEEAKDMPVTHPYLYIARIKMDIQSCNEEAIKCAKEDDKIEDILAEKYKDILSERLEEAKKLHKEYSDDVYILVCCGDLALILKRYDDAKIFYDCAKKLSPNSYIVNGKLAELNYHIKEYKMSRDMCLDLLKINHYDSNIRAGMIRANLALIDEYKEKISDLYLEMGWSYYQSYMFKDAIKVLASCTPQTLEKKCEYNNLLGRSLLCEGKIEEALEHFFTWKELVEGIEDVYDETNAKLVKRKEYINFLIGDCYLKLEDYSNANEYIDIALSKDHDEILLSYEAKCELLFKLGEYEDCVRMCEELIDKDNNSYIAHSYIAKSFLAMGMLSEAMAASERAIAVYPYIAEIYDLQVMIYLKINEVEKAYEVVSRYENFGIDSYGIKYAKAKILIHEEKYLQAEAILKMILDENDTEKIDIEDMGEVRLALADIYENMGNNEAAIPIYEDMIIDKMAVKKYKSFLYGTLGGCYKRVGRYKEALEMFDRQINLNESFTMYLQRGALYISLSMYEQAENDLKCALELRPGDILCNIHLGIISERRQNYKLAADYYLAALDYAEKSGDKFTGEVKRTLLLLGRVAQVMHDFELSISYYKKYIEKFGVDALVSYDYAEVLRRNNEIKTATGLLEECIKTCDFDDNLLACMRTLVDIYGNEGYVDKAFEVYELAVSKDSEDARIYAIMGDIFKINGIYSEAEKMYQKAIELDLKKKYNNYYSDLLELYSLQKQRMTKEQKQIVTLANDRICEDTPLDVIKTAIVYKCIKDDETARKYLEKALSMDRCKGCYYSRCHEAFYNLGLLYEKIKDYDTALAYYKKALEVFGHNALYERKIKELEEK